MIRNPGLDILYIANMEEVMDLNSLQVGRKQMTRHLSQPGCWKTFGTDGIQIYGVFEDNEGLWDMKYIKPRDMTRGLRIGSTSRCKKTLLSAGL